MLPLNLLFPIVLSSSYLKLWPSPKPGMWSDPPLWVLALEYVESFLLNRLLEVFALSLFFNFIVNSPSSSFSWSSSGSAGFTAFTNRFLRRKSLYLLLIMIIFPGSKLFRMSSSSLKLIEAFLCFYGFRPRSNSFRKKLSFSYDAICSIFCDRSDSLNSLSLGLTFLGFSSRLMCDLTDFGLV